MSSSVNVSAPREEPPAGNPSSPSVGIRPYVEPLPALKNWWHGLARFSGRASRSEFWWALLFVFVAPYIVSMSIIGAAFGMLALTSVTPDSTGSPTFRPERWMVITAVTIFLVLWVTILLLGLALMGVAVRRLHDANFSGWFLALCLVPMGSTALMILMALPGHPAGARFDPASS